LDNYANSYSTKRNEVEILSKSVDIANSLFRYAKADDVEVLLTLKKEMS